MVTFGGAGPLHAARLARNVGIPTVIVPQGAGVGSAIGLLQAEPRLDVSATRLLRLDQVDANDAIAAIYEELTQRAEREVAQVSAEAQVTWSRFAQMRYAGQGFEIRVELPGGDIGPDFAQQAMDAFNAAYFQRNKFLDDEGVIEAVDWSLVATLPRSSTGNIETAGIDATAPAARKTRDCWFPETGFVETPILTRSHLAGGAPLAGPAIIEGPGLHRRHTARRQRSHQRQRPPRHRDCKGLAP